VQTSASTAVVLSALSSYDPSSRAQQLTYNWSCSAPDDAPCVGVVPDAPTQTLVLNGSDAGLRYTFVLEVSDSSTRRSSTASSSVVVVLAEVPLIRIAQLGAAKVSPDAKLVLRANVTSHATDASLALAWTIFAAPAGARALTDVAATPLTQPTLVLTPGALVAGATYTFMLSARDSNGESAAKISVPVAARPAGGSLAVSRATGAALTDSFTLNTSGWLANEDVPGSELQYAFSYSVEGVSAVVMLQDFGPASWASTLLPAGNITFDVVARNAFGVLSDPAAPVTTSAIVSPVTTVTDPGALLTAVSGGATAALSSGNAAGAASLAGAMAALLNDPSVTSGVSAAQQQETRAALLDTLASAAALPPTPGGLSATAAAVSLVVGGGGAGLSPAGTQAAVSLLSSLAAVPGGVLPPSAASSVAGALSSLASPTASVALLGQLGSVVTSLGASMMASMSEPGESVTISSPSVQMTLQLDDAGPGSRLFSAPLSAPGSSSSFAALPADALSAAPPGVAVQTSFTSLAFDPYAGGNGTGVTSLSFSSRDGGEIPVHGLAVPITFSMPALALDADSQAVCRFWDPAAGVYSTDGCATLPNPAPAASFLQLAWANFTLTAPASVAAAWTATGPLMAGCTEMYLDCGNATQRVLKVVMNPEDVFSMPPITCGAATSGVLRVFSGTACELYKSSNAADCAWDTIKQSFSGAGCVPAVATQCACTHLTSFAGQAAPKVAVCSAQDLVSLNPADLVSKLKLLFIAVTCLFGAMHVLAGAALVQDKHDTRDTLASFTSADVGFVRQPCGAMTWCFLSLPMEDELGAAGGTMDALASAMGLPLARLRCALPEEFCAGVTPQLVGRKTGLSSVHIQRNATARMSMLTSAKPKRQQSMRLSGSTDKPSGHAPATGGALAHELQPSVAAPLESHRLDRHKPPLSRPRLSVRQSPALGVPTPPTRHELLAGQPERQQPRAPEELEQEPVSPRLHGHLPAEWVAATAMMHAALAIRCLLPPCEVRCAQHYL
jgi:hypothetical protein